MFEIDNTQLSNSLMVGDCPSPTSFPDYKFVGTGSEISSIDLPTPDSPPEVPEEYQEGTQEENSTASDDTSSEEEEDEENSSVSANVDDVLGVERTNQVPGPVMGRRDASTETTVELRAEVPAADRPSHISILGGKYLLLANPPTPSSPSPSSSLSASTGSKNTQKCVHVDTREQFLCKIIPRNMAGLNLLGAYHRLDDFGSYVNTIHEIIMSPKCFYLIFPVNYGNVHAYLLAKKRLREEEAAHLFRQMVAAVKHCHSNGIILRDLKLGKFVFTDKERTTIKLESLEDAVVLPNIDDDGLSDKHGCPNYVSPEKAEILRSNSRYPGKATDIWGLGVMLYTMLVGRYPFNDPDHGKLFVKIRRCLFSIPENLSQNVKCVIRCLLRKEPNSRLSCDAILQHPWILNNGRNPRDPSRAHTALICAPNLLHDSMVSITTQDIFGRGMKRRVEAESSSDDQVVPEWTPPSKVFKEGESITSD